tara:strand:- start:111 stop:326 length:216 start_codon:yes stop_codon:yes gene_type:complete
MFLSPLPILQVVIPQSLNFTLLLVGALFTASVGVMISSFYLDEYWVDEEYRNNLRLGAKATDNNQNFKVQP